MMHRAPFQSRVEGIRVSIVRPPCRRWMVSIAAMLLVVTACGGSQGGIAAVASAAMAAPGTTTRNTPAATAAISIRDFAFEPATLSISAGSKVTWTNRDDEPHLVVSADARFHASPALDTDDTYAAVFAKPGTYGYFCSIHPHMVGRIVVK